MVLEGLPHPELAALWARRNGLAPADVADAAKAEKLEQKSSAFRRLFGHGRDIGQPLVADLLPEWAAPEIACPRPPAELIAWLQRRPPLWLRAQQPDAEAVARELAAAGLEPVRHGSALWAMQVGHPRVNLYTLAAYRDGRVEVQDLASQLVGTLCAPQAGQRWWDACAGGGGKSLLLAQLMGRRGTVVATDIREHKLENLKMRSRRAGFPNIQPRAWDGKALPRDRATFDGVLVDAPCTCSGTWRRNPAARWSLRRGEMAEMAALQRELLRKAASGVKPGGVLVYATCSFFRRENEDVAAAFLADRTDFKPDAFAHPLTGAATAGAVQIWPWDGDCDAMFIARFRRGD
jgi:16S rRNA (cytosine967-C5)-methyltransferase